MSSLDIKTSIDPASLTSPPTKSPKTTMLFWACLLVKKVPNSEKEITKAYRLKALELHPDKRPDDPNAHDNFQKLTTSYAVLKDEKARKLFDDLLRVKRERFQLPKSVTAGLQAPEDDVRSRRKRAFKDSEIFEEIGLVEDVVIKSSKKKGSALVVMVSKDAADAAIGNVSGDLSNPLLVLPLQPASSPVNFGVEANIESDGPKLSNLVGAGY
ncbi:dnaJ homolog subfamily C member 17 [Olea europaea subsp. europaea]|uniref:DnaJ homolog subfamily C member 17 n=1 Tax=Olea europaea subsp. europaea TaxID=158383 RepID=A0A8S0SA23_OLEEU|nr:dnaJ homolog subfamily C member 17 [Olea europaea subsp. europaea]